MNSFMSRKCYLPSMFLALCYTLLMVNPVWSAVQGEQGSVSIGSSTVVFVVLEAAPQPTFSPSVASTLGEPRFVAPPSVTQLAPTGLEAKADPAATPAPGRDSTGDEVAMNAIRMLESVGVLNGESDLGEWVSQQLADTGEASLSVCLPTQGGNVSLLDSGNESSAFIGGGQSSARALAVSLSAGSNGGSAKCTSGSVTTLSLYAISATAAGPAEGKDAEEVKETPTEENKEASDKYLVVRLVVTPQ